MFEKVQQYAKAIVSLVGAVLTAGAFTLPDEVQLWVGLVMAVLTAVATYAVPNKSIVISDAPDDDAPKHVA